jgi:hypothetical protein
VGTEGYGPRAIGGGIDGVMGDFPEQGFALRGMAAPGYINIDVICCTTCIESAQLLHSGHCFLASVRGTYYHVSACVSPWAREFARGMQRLTLTPMIFCFFTSPSADLSTCQISEISGLDDQPNDSP